MKYLRVDSDAPHYAHCIPLSAGAHSIGSSLGGDNWPLGGFGLDQRAPLFLRSSHHHHPIGDDDPLDVDGLVYRCGRSR